MYSTMLMTMMLMLLLREMKEKKKKKGTDKINICCSIIVLRFYSK
jgi:hypothetical protein